MPLNTAVPRPFPWRCARPWFPPLLFASKLLAHWRAKCPKPIHKKHCGPLGTPVRSPSDCGANGYRLEPACCFGRAGVTATTALLGGSSADEPPLRMRSLWRSNSSTRDATSAASLMTVASLAASTAAATRPGRALFNRHQARARANTSSDVKQSCEVRIAALISAGSPLTK